ncbi:hypothetical protein EJ110_NYTH26746 [Nymphaea thermarum]|nr:hypothetical protein EJ110_NYTH26746 [Nymphaea thermarum]
MESYPLPPNLLSDVDLTIVSATHLKNVNCRRGALAPYAVVSCFDEPNYRLPTTVDSSDGTKPLWNQRFALSISVCRPLPISFLTFDIVHSDDGIHPSSSSISVAFPLVVGSACLPLMTPSRLTPPLWLSIGIRGLGDGDLHPTLCLSDKASYLLLMALAVS